MISNKEKIGQRSSKCIEVEVIILNSLAKKGITEMMTF